MKKRIIGGILLVIIVIAAIFGIVNSHKNTGMIKLDKEYYNKGEFVEVNKDELPDKGTYVLFIYNNFCAFSIPCDKIFEEYMQKYKVDILKMPFESFNPVSNEFASRSFISSRTTTLSTTTSIV